MTRAPANRFRHHDTQWGVSWWLAVGLLSVVACRQDGAQRGPARIPPKPGESITHSQMCTCRACEIPTCCRELEQDVPETTDCADGYDFSKCELPVQSCTSRCFQHRWRIHVDESCEETKPGKCCDQAE